MIYYPILFKKCTVNKFTFSDNVTFQKMTLEKRISLLGIKSAELDLKNGGIRKITYPKNKKGVMSAEMFFNGSFLGGYSTDLLASNYLIVFTEESYEDFLAINTAIKLWKPTSSGICYSIQPDKNTFGFSPPSHFGGLFGYAEMRTKDFRQVKRLFDKYKKISNDEHLKLMVNAFFHALSGEKMDVKIRFTQLTTILEMLYVPKGQQELNYRLAVRAAKVMSKNKNNDAVFFFKEIKKIYDIRSQIVHQGDYKKEDLQKYLGLLAEVVRNSLLVYLENPTVFEDDMLNAIVLTS